MDLRVGSLPKVRILPNPENGLRTLVERAPQAEAWADRIMQKLRPTLTILYDIRRRIATAAIAALAIWLFVHVTFGANGMVVYQRKKAEYQSLQKEIRSMQQENDRSAQQIKSLQTDPKAIEKEAREQLHYARPGEVIYVSPPPPAPPASPPSNAARR
jgi:cell division protein FtsB